MKNLSWIVVLLFAGAVMAASAVEPLGYAWPKTSLLVTNVGPLNVKPLRNGGAYPLLAKLKDGYLIACEGRDGEQHAAILPLRDRLGYPLTVVVAGDKVVVTRGRWILNSLDTVDLKPPVIELMTGKKYTVVRKDEDKFWLEVFLHVETQTAQVAIAEAMFLPSAEYKTAVDSTLDGLKSKATQQIESGHFYNVGDMFRAYAGRFAEDTVDVRRKLAEQFDHKALSAQQEKEHRFEEAQQAKGLVKYGDEWITLEERGSREARIREAAAQREAEAARQVELRRAEAAEAAQRDAVAARESERAAAMARSNDAAAQFAAQQATANNEAGSSTGVITWLMDLVAGAVKVIVIIFLVILGLFLVIGAAASSGKQVIPPVLPEHGRAVRSHRQLATPLSPQTFSTTCPYCGATRNFRLSSIGKTIRCKACNARLHLNRMMWPAGEQYEGESFTTLSDWKEHRQSGEDEPDEVDGNREKRRKRKKRDTLAEYYSYLVLNCID